MILGGLYTAPKLLPLLCLRLEECIGLLFCCLKTASTNLLLTGGLGESTSDPIEATLLSSGVQLVIIPTLGGFFITAL